MRLHEYYFENLGGKPRGQERQAGKKLAESFGSYEAWRRISRVRAPCVHRLGGPLPGPANGRLLNFWINEHDVAHPAGGTPILIMDVFEHAFMLDYGLKRADYIEAFFKNIDWKAVEARLK